MEYALNNDYRRQDNNLLVQTYDGNPGIPAGGVTVYFRYNSSRGFALWAQPTNALLGANSVQIQIMPCNWISNANSVHGFGFPFPVYQNGTNVPVYGPNPSPQLVYYAEAPPTLLPLRYIAILSPELTKDRRIPSFHSAQTNSFNNEIAIFSLSLKNSGVWHEENTNEDSTVISLRDNYSPQQMTFQMVNDQGKILITGQNLATFLSAVSANTVVSTTNLFSALTQGTYGGNRLDPFSMNRLIFNADVYPYLPSTYYPPASPNLYGPNNADLTPDDLSHELVVIIRDN
jgi:hypothetical protein